MFPKKAFRYSAAPLLSIILLTFFILPALLRQDKSSFNAYATSCSYSCYYQYCPTGYTTISTQTCSSSQYVCCRYNSPTATPRPPTSTPIPASCSGNCYYQYCPTGYTPASGSCQTNFMCCRYNSPTATPRPPTSTPIPASCSGNCYYQYCPTGYTPASGSCQTNFMCCRYASSNTPTRPPPTPTPNTSHICTPGTSICTDPALNSPTGPTLKTCNSSGTSWTTTSCSSTQECNWHHTACVNPIVPTVTPPPECSNGNTTCRSGKRYTCVSGEWTMNTYSGNCTRPTPTPLPNPDTFDCPIRNGYPVCDQTDPKWANNSFPGGCETSTNNYIYQAACVPASTCSTLCDRYRNSTYCNLDNCITAVPAFQTLTCNGVQLSVARDALNNAGLNYISARPDIFVDSQGQPLTIPQFSTQKLRDLLEHGPIIVGGHFKINATGENIVHVSKIVGYDTATGKFIFNDPYFNSQNTNPNRRTSSSQLEEFMTISIDSVIFENDAQT